MKKQLIITSLIIGVIILLSLLLFSSVYYPLFNSDDGITVLMLHNFELPRDFYFWGQSRFGSIIPLLGQVFYKGFGLSSLWSESITHYIILILGYLSFATLLKSNFSKIIFAIIWFLPLLHFHHGLLRNVFGLQYSLLGMGIYLINRYSISETTFLKKTLILTLLFIVFVLSVWVSDAAIITIFMIILILTYYSYQKKKSITSLVFRIETLYTIIGVVLGGAIILYLKKTAKVDVADNYNIQLFNSFEEFLSSVSIIKNVLFDVLCFNTPNPLVSIYSYCVGILLISLPFFKINFDKLGKNKKWFYLFVIDGTIVLFIVLISHWAFLNGVARRYFTGVYISFWLACLIYTNEIIKTKQKTILQALILITVIIGSFGTIYNFKYVYPKRLTPKSVVVSEFEQLGEIGLIANYWNSYGTSFINPELIKATPHDKSSVRNYDLVDSVFSQPRLYLIKDSWLDSFPETLNQFGYKLRKEGEEFNIGDCWINEYKKESVNRTYNID